ncbi:MAG: hypothetical protein CMK56_03965 [Proteobacteria bacterium]|nr:hypothetical protein [Pseudomonadota bacterium]|tara:strand:- start:237 stop:998 length:762 start_codon:yes stop_codon:yes gene_type:complete
MRVIDAHINITKNGKWFNTSFDCSLKKAQSEIKLNKIDAAGLVSPYCEKINSHNIQLVKKNKNLFTGFTLENNSVQTVKKLQKLDFNFIKFFKIHPRSSKIRPLDKKNNSIFKIAIKQDIPIIFCGYMRGDQIPLSELQPLVYDEIAKQYPKLKIIISHAGSYRPLDALAVAQSNKNVFLDLSHVLMYFKKSNIINDLLYIIEKVDQKVIYGSDFPEYSISKYLKYTLNLTKNIKKNKLENFFYKNAKKVFKI